MPYRVPSTNTRRAGRLRRRYHRPKHGQHRVGSSSEDRDARVNFEGNWQGERKCGARQQVSCRRGSCEAYTQTAPTDNTQTFKPPNAAEGQLRDNGQPGRQTPKIPRWHARINRQEATMTHLLTCA